MELATQIEIQSRDKEILQAIYEHRFLLMSQIRRYFFNNAAERVVRKRLKKLERAGLIRRELSVIYQNQRIIRLTGAGEGWITKGRPEELLITKRFDLATLAHDAIVSSVRFRLQELWDGVWIPEAALKKKEFPQIPDGVLVFPSGHQAAIEVENSPKGVERFQKNQERWRKVRVHLVLYVATTEAMFKSVQRYLQAGPNDLPFGLVLWTELERGVPKVWTVAGELDLFSRRSL